MVVSIVLYGCTTWTLTKRAEKELASNYARIMNKSWRQYPTKEQLRGHLSPKLSKLDEPDLPDTVGEVRKNT